MNIRFDQKVALITGASTGIGAASAIEFAKCGASVVVNYNRSEEAADKVVSQIKSDGGTAVAVKADVSKADQVEFLVKKTLDSFGQRLDILVNNAGGMVERRAMQEMTEDLWNECLAVNYTSVFLCTKAVVPIMKSQKYGRIINLTSIAARNGGGWGSGHYAAAKAAVLNLSKNLAKELVNSGITVNNVSPGVITTPFHEKFTAKELRDKFGKMIPLAREGTAQEVAYTILFLASDYANYILGETIEINGGMLMD
jgi:3-oxoacyl-[acyl-carrier protein] reductase